MKNRLRDPVTGQFISNVNNLKSNVDSNKLKQLQSTIATLKASNNAFKEKIYKLNKSKAAYIKQINQFKSQPNDLKLNKLIKELESSKDSNSKLKKQLTSYLIPSNLIKQTILTLNEEYTRFYKSLQYRYIFYFKYIIFNFKYIYIDLKLIVIINQN